MNAEEAVVLKQTRKPIRAEDADLSGSTFMNVRMRQAHFADADLTGARINDANLAGATIQNVNLTGVSIEDCLLEDMTINGIAVVTLLATYQEKNG